MATQLSMAREGVVTDAMRMVAEDEGLIRAVTERVVALFARDTHRNRIL